VGRRAVRSTLVEFARFHDLETGVLRKGDDYIRTVARHPVRQVTMGISQKPFNTMMRKLRYEQASEDERQQALADVSDLVTDLLDRHRNDDGDLVEGKLLESLGDGDGAVQQIDLVVNASELAALPFECALDGGGMPIFLDGDGIVITRRVRRDSFAETAPNWPVQPRVLFAWSAAGGDVPSARHREALLRALAPWLPLLTEKQITGEEALGNSADAIAETYVEVGNAKLSDLEAAVGEGGYTHVHLLAHGHPVGGGDDARFGVAFDHPIEGKDVVAPDQLSAALGGLLSSAVVVTLAACDAGNQGDTINPEKSLAYELHVDGFPVVVASQLPLTIAGSNLLVKDFYTDLFEGLDVRAALHRARVRLYQERDVAGHDWVSLVGYVQLPEGYATLLAETRLASQLAALKNVREHTETLAARGADQDEWSRVIDLLTGRVDALATLLSDTGDPDDLDENRGLLGSAEKRLAEICFHYLDDESSTATSRAALERASDWYRTAFEENRKHHWTGVQYLALHAAVTGEVDLKHWTTCCRAAELDRLEPAEYWAQGSLAELALLGRIIDQETDEDAQAYIDEMVARVAALPEPPSYSPFAATRLQLRRYVDWWRQDDGFFPGTVDLAPAAGQLANSLTD